jgi:predicted rRNA methylase YqxC with S4 and FtsJ domains
MLQHGAKRVYAVDVGYGQLDWRLRTDERVVVMERTNARNMQPDWFEECLISLPLTSPLSPFADTSAAECLPAYRRAGGCAY